MNSFISFATFLSLSFAVRNASFTFTHGFHITPHVNQRSKGTRPKAGPWTALATTAVESSDTDVDQEQFNVRAPLKFIGPYPCLGVRFPGLSTEAQRERNETGVTLDFVLDTAANTNTVNAQVAQALNLTVIGQAPPGMGSAGPIDGDLPTYLLGDMQLEGLGEDIFMQNVTASALPIASPASAGLLSLAFFQSIGEGVEFDWHGDVDAQVPPSITFYSDSSNATQGRTRVNILRLPVTQLPTVMIQINGQMFPALLDTGSPITVLNAQAAKKAGISAAVAINDSFSHPKKSKNPFSAFKDRLEEAQAAAQGKILAIFGAGGKRINLVQSSEPVKVSITSAENDDQVVDVGTSHVYVGDLPGLAALQGLGEDAPPAVVLGMDVLRQNRHMFFRPRFNEVWF